MALVEAFAGPAVPRHVAPRRVGGAEEAIRGTCRGLGLGLGLGLVLVLVLGWRGRITVSIRVRVGVRE